MFAKLKFREQVLLIFAMIVVVGMGYFLFRLRPRQQMIKNVENQSAKIKKDIRDGMKKLGIGKLDGNPVQSPEMLEEKLNTLEKEIVVRQKRLESCRRFASLVKPDAVQKLNLDLTRLAETTGVRIRERLPYSSSSMATTATGPFLDPSLLSKLSEGSLQMQKLVVEAPFVNLSDFLEGLNRLEPWRVTIVRFEIQAITPNDQTTKKQPLNSTLILAL